MNTKVFHQISYGLYVITTLDKNRPTGCVANSSMQITSSPATLALSMNHDNYTNQCIKESGYFAINILGENTDNTLIGTFGFKSGKDIDKFAGIDYDTKEGLPILKNTCGYIICKVIDKMETSTHTVFLGEVLDGDVLSEDNPMTYSYYHKVIKGRAPKNAPTYIPKEEPQTKETWVCSVCGYVYDQPEPFESLPDTWTCPVCGVPKSKFEKK
ncbi:flavin reductase (DIM6/NTAB) family NADH-FMN oxidoreductase RutF/rubredoxin [Aequitasia blattaphilus]|uniref:Flavin reductase n=1 Tax=Aequitasia blattaphilus TaxID=2949332 RepID=A0ABT1EC97_9FIRM|nr:flavin reductase [Aequitasia blattaphilus]MCP1103474.1 flavin reductase [Aequitasia blattaphilus]MCR8616114.1 flavin reductase [Aequitasia blattaphilus]